MSESNNKLQIIVNEVKKELQKQNVEYIEDKYLIEIYNLLILYFSGSKEFENYSFITNTGKNIPYSLKKGLLLIGKTGRSKSF